VRLTRSFSAQLIAPRGARPPWRVSLGEECTQREFLVLTTIITQLQLVIFITRATISPETSIIFALENHSYFTNNFIRLANNLDTPCGLVLYCPKSLQTKQGKR
jgi:hypothetical protein